MRRWVLAGIAMLMLAAGAVGQRLLREPDAPTVDSAMRAEVLPVLDRHLETRPLGLDRTSLLATQAPRLHPRWFCSEHVLEARPQPDRLLVGVDAICSEFARDADRLVAGTGFRAPLLVTLARRRGGLMVVGVEAPRDGSFATDVNRMLSPAGRRAYWRHQGSVWPDEPEPAIAARAAFRLPAATPAGQLP